MWCRAAKRSGWGWKGLPVSPVLELVQEQLDLISRGQGEVLQEAGEFEGGVLGADGELVVDAGLPLRVRAQAGHGVAGEHGGRPQQRRILPKVIGVGAQEGHQRGEVRCQVVRACLMLGAEGEEGAVAGGVADGGNLLDGEEIAGAAGHGWWSHGRTGEPMTLRRLQAVGRDAGVRGAGQVGSCPVPIVLPFALLGIDLGPPERDDPGTRGAVAHQGDNCRGWSGLSSVAGLGEYGPPAKPRLPFVYWDHDLLPQPPGAPPTGAAC